MENPTRPMPPRTILVALTALDAGIVVVQPMGGGTPQVLQGDEGKSLHALALDPKLPVADTAELNSGTLNRLFGFAEKLIGE
jgi:hypothetical protein